MRVRQEFHVCVGRIVPESIGGSEGRSAVVAGCTPPGRQSSRRSSPVVACGGVVVAIGGTVGGRRRSCGGVVVAIGGTVGGRRRSLRADGRRHQRDGRWSSPVVRGRRRCHRRDGRLAAGETVGSRLGGLAIGDRRGRQSGGRRRCHRIAAGALVSSVDSTDVSERLPFPFQAGGRADGKRKRECNSVTGLSGSLDVANGPCDTARIYSRRHSR